VSLTNLEDDSIVVWYTPVVAKSPRMLRSFEKYPAMPGLSAITQILPCRKFSIGLTLNLLEKPRATRAGNEWDGIRWVWANARGCPKVNTCTHTMGMNVCLRENGRGGLV
jgi:hypothetical protein